MHNGASNEIKESEVCKRCPKVNPYYAPIFDPIMFIPFLDDAKLPRFYAKCVALANQLNTGCIYTVLKKARKQQFYLGSPSL